MDDATSPLRQPGFILLESSMSDNLNGFVIYEPSRKVYRTSFKAYRHALVGDVTENPLQAKIFPTLKAADRQRKSYITRMCNEYEAGVVDSSFTRGVTGVIIDLTDLEVHEIWLTFPPDRVK